jgi:hypothetical protein
MFFDSKEGVYRCAKTGQSISTHSVAQPIECSYFVRRKNEQIEVEVERKYQNAIDDDKAALHLKLKRLEEEYRLAHFGLAKGMLSVVVAMGCFLTTFAMEIFGKWLSGDNILGGVHLVVIAVVLAFAIIIYFSFVFGRRSRLSAEITKTKSKIEMVSGENER